MKGYANLEYVSSLEGFGRPRLLPACGGWILDRIIPQTTYYDSRAPYPLFVCDSWENLHKDLVALNGSGLVSLVAVTDPFGDYTEEMLHQCFPDLMRPFKQHYIIDYQKPFLDKVTKHHRYYERKALGLLQVEHCPNPTLLLNEWFELYNILIQKHKISGVQAFSRAAFERQLSLPNMTVFRAVKEGKTVGIHLWIQDQDVAYSHLTAFNDDGYRSNASYALYGFAVQYFSGRVRWLDLGSGAGLADDASDGLSWFKRGWSNAEKKVYLCGVIFDHGVYASLTEKFSQLKTNFFPVYRSGDSG